jgi:phenylpropionate dioxygenase-like ring-hydroxylating dioxygenase large terminal subunit
MSFLRNHWYCAAWGEELSTQPLARTILGEKLVFFRKSDGAVAAIGGICPHRFAPLAEGKVLGDVLSCRYHGLQFGADGRCVHNPHGNVSPPALKVAAYKIVERYGAAWIWMGDADKLDESRIPELWGHADPGFRSVHGLVSVQGSYELVADNLLDLSHTQYLHSFLTTVDDPEMRRVFEVQQEGDKITTISNTLNGSKFGFSQFVWPDSPERIDTYSGIRWEAPANMLLKVHFAPAGQSEADGIHSWGAELVTPETETTCHYFWSNARDFRLDDLPFEQQLKEAIQSIFTSEDAWMISLVQANMGDETDLVALRPVILPTDNAALRARRVVRRLLRGEEQARQAVVRESPAMSSPDS